MHVDCWIQQVTTRVGAVTCWIQQSVSPKQVVGFSCLFNSEVDQLISKVIVSVKKVKIMRPENKGVVLALLPTIRAPATSCLKQMVQK